MEEKSRSKQRWLIPALLAVVILLLAVILAFILLRPGDSESDSNDGTPKLTYAEGVIALDEESLQAAIDEMNQTPEGSITLEYKNDALSNDGINFSCYLANAAENTYDMYIQIFSDVELTDQLFLSGLVRPGDRFHQLTLEHELEKGNHQVYVAFTQVEEDLASIHSQVVYTMNFVVQ